MVGERNCFKIDFPKLTPHIGQKSHAKKVITWTRWSIKDIKYCWYSFKKC